MSLGLPAEHTENLLDVAIVHGKQLDCLLALEAHGLQLLDLLLQESLLLLELRVQLHSFDFHRLHLLVPLQHFGQNELQVAVEFAQQLRVAPLVAEAELLEFLELDGVLLEELVDLLGLAAFLAVPFSSSRPASLALRRASLALSAKESLRLYEIATELGQDPEVLFRSVEAQLGEVLVLLNVSQFLQCLECRLLFLLFFLEDLGDLLLRFFDIAVELFEHMQIAPREVKAKGCEFFVLLEPSLFGELL